MKIKKHLNKLAIIILSEPLIPFNVNGHSSLLPQSTYISVCEYAFLFENFCEEVKRMCAK